MSHSVKTVSRQRIHRRIRKKARGSAERPRVAVFRSVHHIYAQAIDDEKGKTLAAFSSVSKEARTELKGGGNVSSAKAIGVRLAERLKEKGIKKIVFDRGGFKYHGRIKAFADALREKGIEF
jgi:large subunit ribosomal protein L18